MKRKWFYILLAVAESPSYGTAIQEEVRTLSNQSFRLWPATLYGSLEELTELGWLEELGEGERPASIAGRERFYRLTPVGRGELMSEIARLEGLTAAARARLPAG